MKVVYGHTDSIYVNMTMDDTNEILSILNNHVRGLFPNLLGLDEHPVTIEFEKYYESLGVGYTKNRNAGLITWKDGKYLEEPEFVMTGFAAKRVINTLLAKETQLTVLRMWVDDKSEKEVTSYLRGLYSNILNGNVPKASLIKRVRFKPERFNYHCKNCSKPYSAKDAIHKNQTPDYRTTFRARFCKKCGNDLYLVNAEGKNPQIGEGVEGVLWWNQNNKEQITDSYVFMRVEDDPRRVKYTNPITGVDKRPSYISAPRTKILMEDFLPDTGYYAESIINKAMPIYKAMGWDISSVRKNINQRTMDEWW